MKIKRYVKKAIPIEAIQLKENNVDTIKDFVGDAFKGMYEDNGKTIGILICTLEDVDCKTPHLALFNDYIIKGIKGEFYPCKPDVFKESYVEYKGKS